MKKILCSGFLFFVVLTVCSAFPNCNIYEKDDPCYEACKQAEKGVEAFVGSIPFQTHLLKSIELCPEFSFAYFELSVPYAKMGLMHEWVRIMDKAVEANPSEHLGWRGWYHWFFMHNYEKAITDIEQLDAIVSYDIGQTGDGLYHLNILKALCYKGLGNTEKAIEIMETTMREEYYVQGAYDMLHLGVLYFEKDDYQKALELLEKQNDYNPVSEAYYYSAQCYSGLGNITKAKERLEKSLSMYNQRLAMTDSYRQLPDEIYRSDIENLIEIYAIEN